MSCGGDHRYGSDPVLLWLWCRLAATAWVRLLAWECPYAMGVTLKQQKKKKKRENEKERKKERKGKKERERKKEKEGRKERKKRKERIEAVWGSILQSAGRKEIEGRKIQFNNNI